MFRIKRAGGAMRICPLGGNMVRSLVETFTVAAVPSADGVTGLTGKLQLVPFGSPLQLKLTGWLNPAIELSTTV
jgi:hypothetical protein